MGIKVISKELTSYMWIHTLNHSAPLDMNTTRFNQHPAHRHSVRTSNLVFHSLVISFQIWLSMQSYLQFHALQELYQLFQLSLGPHRVVNFMPQIAHSKWCASSYYDISFCQMKIAISIVIIATLSNCGKILKQSILSHSGNTYDETSAKVDKIILG